jgi:hypothetical protein
MIRLAIRNPLFPGIPAYLPRPDDRLRLIFCRLHVKIRWCHYRTSAKYLPNFPISAALYLIILRSGGSSFNAR